MTEQYRVSLVRQVDHRRPDYYHRCGRRLDIARARMLRYLEETRAMESVVNSTAEMLLANGVRPTLSVDYNQLVDEFVTVRLLLNRAKQSHSLRLEETKRAYWYTVDMADDPTLPADIQTVDSLALNRRYPGGRWAVAASCETLNVRKDLI